jgi:hypothetical protein
MAWQVDNTRTVRRPESIPILHLKYSQTTGGISVRMKRNFLTVYRASIKSYQHFQNKLLIVIIFRLLRRKKNLLCEGGNINELFSENRDMHHVFEIKVTILSSFLCRIKVITILKVTSVQLRNMNY